MSQKGTPIEPFAALTQLQNFGIHAFAVINDGKMQVYNFQPFDAEIPESATEVAGIYGHYKADDSGKFVFVQDGSAALFRSKPNSDFSEVMFYD